MYIDDVYLKVLIGLSVFAVSVVFAEVWFALPKYKRKHGKTFMYRIYCYVFAIPLLAIACIVIIGWIYLVLRWNNSEWANEKLDS